ncbi:MAG TPA: septal ring lytic transglycosylase RlpA family protein [Candidatus Acidoferrum sp.]|nr:septal ring lytic transglycosylase RlpA family protein [Candidatus Acidoferrum sp.]
MQRKKSEPETHSARQVFIGALILLVCFVIGCGQHYATASAPPPPRSTNNPQPSTARPATPAPASGTTSGNSNEAAHAQPGPPLAVMLGAPVEHGIASWYGVPYHGRRASNGEIYDMYKMTAAHRTLPFNTIVRVTNITNGKHVDVRITDRGPFVEDRIIDLSLAAAREIDMVGAGTARVMVEILAGSPPITAGAFSVQIGAFAERTNAERVRNQLGPKYSPIFIQDYDSPSGHLFRVRVGSVPSEGAAQQLASKLQTETGFQTFVVRLDDAPVSAPRGAGELR